MRRNLWIVFLGLAFLLIAPWNLFAGSNLPKNVSFGTASWYSESDPGINFRTANGEIFDDSERTCASWNFPFGTLLKVTHTDSGKSVVCRVNDRGPAKKLGRVIDLTKSAFREVAPLKTGLIPVRVEKIGEAGLGFLNQHREADSYEQDFDQNEEGPAGDSFQNLFGRVGTQAHYQTETQPG